MEKLNEKMIVLGRESRALMQTELADKLNLSQASVSKIEKAEIPLQEEALQKLIKELKYPESFFYQKGEVIPTILSYRSRKKVAQKLMAPIEAKTNIYRLNICKLFQYLRFSESKLPVIDISKNLTPGEAAEEVRKQWGILSEPIKNLTQLLESQNIIIASFDFGTERVDSRSILALEKNPIIVINKLLLGDRLRFTLAHELGHLVMHLYTNPDLSRDISHEANLFAAEFLMPESEIRKDFNVDITIPVLAELKKKWKVSMQALLYRAHDLSVITDNQKRYLVGQFNALNIRRREPVELDVPKEQASLLRDLVTRYRTKQKMSVAAMAAFFNLTQEEFIEMYS